MNAQAETIQGQWSSECCNAIATEPLSFSWFGIRSGGTYEELKRGTCGKCGERANFRKADA